MFQEMTYFKPKSEIPKRFSFNFVLTYNPNLPSINGLIKKHFHLSLSSPKLKELFPPNSIILSFRWSKNLKKILAPSKCRKGPLHSIVVPAAGCFNCDKTRCDLCKNFFVNSETFSSAQTGKTYFVRQKLSCNSSNVIYLGHCGKCNLQYVGSTTTEFKVRFRNHKSSMKTNRLAKSPNTLTELHNCVIGLYISMD